MLNNNFNHGVFNFQNFSSQFSPQAQNLRDKKVFEQFSSKQNKVTCDTPKGHLVRETLPQEFASMIADNVKDVKNLGVALKDGKGTDTQLGRLNDLGMKIGGGVIAAALMGKRATVNKKLMEVIGFGTFFSVMSLWPKVAIDAPTKALRGFNPHQKYIDSNGDKKPFFLDNQYLSWDLWPKEEIDKIADKMNVPKDIEDRQEYTKEKMRTIAMQDNTLWMLTAGFSTPILTSLACNRIEEGMRVPLANMTLRNVASQFKPEKTEKLVEKTLKSDIFKTNDELFGGVIKSLREGTVPEDMDDTLRKVFDIAPKNIVGTEVISERFNKSNLGHVDEIINLVKHGKGMDFASIAKTLAPEDTAANVAKLQELLENAHKNAAEFMGTESPEPENVWQQLAKLIRKSKFDPENGPKWAKTIVEDDGIDALMKSLATSSYSDKSCTEMADSLEAIYTKTIRPAQARMKVLGDQVKELNNVSGERYNLFARKMLKSLGLKDKEITQFRNTATIDEQMAIIGEKIKSLVNDPEKYESVKKALVAERDKVEKTGSSIIPGRSKEITIGSVFDGIIETASNGLKKLGASIEVDSPIANGSQLNEILSNGITTQDSGKIRAEISSVDAMIARTFGMLELEDRIKDGSLLRSYKDNCAKLNVPCALDATSSDPKILGALEDFYTDCRKMIWGSSYSDVMNKFQQQGGREGYQAILDTVFSHSDDARVNIWKQMMKSVASDTLFVPNDALQFSYRKLAEQEAIRALGKEAFDKHTDKDGLIARTAERLFGFTEEYINEAGKPDTTKFAELGEATVNTLKKQANQMYNDRTWMKRFGIAAGALVGVTLVSQLFFGKVKDGNLYKKQTQQDTFVSGK